MRAFPNISIITNVRIIINVNNVIQSEGNLRFKYEIVSTG